MENKDEQYFAEITEDTRMKILTIQLWLERKGIEMTATDVLEVCVDTLYMKI